MPSCFVFFSPLDASSKLVLHPLFDSIMQLCCYRSTFYYTLLPYQYSGMAVYMNYSKPTQQATTFPQTHNNSNSEFLQNPFRVENAPKTHLKAPPKYLHQNQYLSSQRPEAHSQSSITPQDPTQTQTASACDIHAKSTERNNPTSILYYIWLTNEVETKLD